MTTTVETPEAPPHDSDALADKANNLLEAAASVTDRKVSEARKRLASALASVKEYAVETYHGAEEKAKARAREADAVIRSHPYESIVVAVGVGVLLGVVLSRRD